MKLYTKRIFRRKKILIFVKFWICKILDFFAIVLGFLCDFFGISLTHYPMIGLDSNHTVAWVTQPDRPNPTYGDGLGSYHNKSRREENLLTN